MDRRIDPLDRLLNSRLDLSQPFTTAKAMAEGMTTLALTELTREGLLRRPLLGVYLADQMPDSLETRVSCLRLVVPADAVITDRTAAWLHGAEMALAPGDHQEVPKISAFQTPGKRLRNQLAHSGERRLAKSDVIEVLGMRVTTPLRTACDLGRLLHRDSALAAMDALLRLDVFSRDQLVLEVERFKGFRGVRQLRALAPFVDAGSESFGESVLRLRWLEAGGLPAPQTQIPVVGDDGFCARLDLGDEDLKYGAEYDGEAFHGAEYADHDRRRRERLAREGWVVDVFRRADVFGARQSAVERLSAGARRARLRQVVGQRS